MKTYKDKFIPKSIKTPGDLLIKSILKRGISVSELAKYSRISVALVSAMMSNDRTISALNSIRLSNVLKCFTPNELLYLQANYLIEKELNKVKSFDKLKNISKLVIQSV